MSFRACMVKLPYGFFQDETCHRIIALGSGWIIPSEREMPKVVRDEYLADVEAFRQKWCPNRYFEPYEKYLRKDDPACS